MRLEIYRRSRLLVVSELDYGILQITGLRKTSPQKWKRLYKPKQATQVPMLRNASHCHTHTHRFFLSNDVSLSQLGCALRWDASLRRALLRADSDINKRVLQREKNEKKAIGVIRAIHLQGSEFKQYITMLMDRTVPMCKVFRSCH